jgi:hypothetical protein
MCMSVYVICISITRFHSLFVFNFNEIHMTRLEKKEKNENNPMDNKYKIQ